MPPHMPWPQPLLLTVVIAWLFPLSAEVRRRHLGAIGRKPTMVTEWEAWYSGLVSAT